MTIEEIDARIAELKDEIAELETELLTRAIRYCIDEGLVTYEGDRFYPVGD